MATLTPNQVLFVLRTIGKEWLYSTGESRPGATFVESFLETIRNPVGELASRLAIEYELDYAKEPPHNIILRNRPHPDAVRGELQTIGLRVPDRYRSSPEEMMRYFEEFGQMYINFNSAETPIVKESWLPGIPRLFVNLPMVAGADIWLNFYLGTHLRDLYTDFDFFRMFWEILDPPSSFDNRRSIISHIVKSYRPAGDFWVDFGFSSIRLRHQLGGRVQTYTTLQGIKSIAYNGQLYFSGVPLPHISLYQVAFLFKPEYAARIYDIELSEVSLGSMKEIYQHFTRQIKIAEQRGEQRVRFSDQLREFNVDLDS